MPAPSGRHGSFSAKILGGENVNNKFVKIFVVALALMSVLFASILPCSAVTVPNYDISDDDYNYYIIFKTEDGFESVFLSTDELVVSVDSNIYCLKSTNGSAKQINISNDTAALFSTPGILGSFSPKDMIATNYDVKYENSDEVFFQQSPLLCRLLNPVQEQVGEKVVADSLTLTICGIGCLALLIGLSLFPKVLYKFL